MAKLKVKVEMSAALVMGFLKSLEAAVPPPTGRHHSLTYGQYGSAEQGWTDKLCLQIQYHCGSQVFFIEESDWAKPDVMVAEISAFVGGR